MQNDLMNFLNDISQTTQKSANELIALNTRVLNQTFERQAKFSAVFIEGSKKQADLLQMAKDPKELVEKQAELAEQYTGIFIKTAKENMEIVQKTGEEYKDWIENNATLANLGVKKPASKRKTA